MRRKNASFCYSVFFLCISTHWLFCEPPGSWSTADGSKQLIGRSRNDVMPTERTAVAVRMPDLPDADGFPTTDSWKLAAPLRFNSDWQGRNADPERETEVRLLWTPELLYLRFHAKFRVITVFPHAEASGRRDQLWDRDVAEVFVQSDPTDRRRYKEFEVSPNGFWIDLDIAPGEKHDLKSGLRRRVILNQAAKTWVAELRLPMNGLVDRFDPAATWRVNFYRIEGAVEPRFYSAWRPTSTPAPNFHVPEAFGELVFAPSPWPRK
jgi:alpha-galactosidase